jgi:hypothetical protein
MKPSYCSNSLRMRSRSRADRPSLGRTGGGIHTRAKAGGEAGPSCSTVLAIYAACFARLAILAMVARLQPVAACMLLQDAPASIMLAMPALRSTSS